MSAEEDTFPDLIKYPETTVLKVSEGVSKTRVSFLRDQQRVWQST